MGAGMKAAGRYSLVSCRTGFGTLPGRAIGHGRRRGCRRRPRPVRRGTRRRPASRVLGPGGPGRAGRARHLPQSRERILRPEDEGAGASRPGDGGRPRRHGGTGGVDHRIGRVGQRPHPRSAVQGALHAHLRAVLGRGHREVSRLGDDPGHRPGLRPQAGPGVRREGLRRHRGRARTAARGAERALFRGTIGEAAAVEFAAFLKVWRELPHPRAILNDPENADIPKNASALIALAPLTKPDPVTLFPGQSPTNPYHCDAGDKAEQMSLEGNVVAQRQQPP